MGLKKVFNLRRLTGINSRGAVEDGDCEESPREASGKDVRRDVCGEEKLRVKSSDELAIAILTGETDSVDSRLQEYTFPIANTDGSVREEVPPAIAKGTEHANDLILQMYETVDEKNDDVSTDRSVAGHLVEETTAFEVLAASPSKDHGSIFSGIVSLDADKINEVKCVPTDDDSTEACASIITEMEGGSVQSDRSTNAVGPETAPAKNGKSFRKHTLQKFFSVMKLLDGDSNRASDETNRATASAATSDNSLEEKSMKSSSTRTDETADESSESSSVAIALFAEDHTSNVKKSRSRVLAPSAASANRDAKTKVVTMMIDNFKQIAGKGACFCEDVYYEQSDWKISGVFSRDVEDSDSCISCSVYNDDAITLDSCSIMDGNRMYM